MSGLKMRQDNQIYVIRGERGIIATLTQLFKPIKPIKLSLVYVTFPHSSEGMAYNKRGTSRALEIRFGKVKK